MSEQGENKGGSDTGDDYEARVAKVQGTLHQIAMERQKEMGNDGRPYNE
jgi:hypothetical protein